MTAQSTKETGRVCWLIEDAVRLVAFLTPIAERHRFNVAIYGSVAKNGKGRDLDLAFFPKAVHDAGKYQELADAIKKSLPAEMGEWHFSDFSGTASAIYTMRDGQLIDAVFHHAHQVADEYEEVFR